LYSWNTCPVSASASPNSADGGGFVCAVTGGIAPGNAIAIANVTAQGIHFLLCIFTALFVTLL